MRPSFFHHLHPPTIPADQSRWRYTLGAGGISAFLAFVLFLTGLLEMFYYVPTPEGAAASVQMITFLVPYGALVRNLHFWAAQGLVITALVHLMRVVLTGAYAPPRRFNYLLGLALFLLILFLDFTGYVLRWDEGIRWALVAGTNLVRSIPQIGPGLYRLVVGADQPGAATLTRFYAWHVFGLAFLLLGLAGWHFFRVRRDGGIAVPPPELRSSQARISRFELVRREALAALLCMALLLVIAGLFPAPIGPAMAPGQGLLSDARAPWFFLWVQQLLKFGGPFTMGVLIPVGVLLFLAALAYVLPHARPGEEGHWFPSGSRLAQALALLLFAAIVLLTILAVVQS